MQTIDVRKDDGRRKDKHQDVTHEEVGAPERQLDDLDHELARRLRHRVRAKTAAVPLAGPPRTVRLVVLELTRKEHRDEDLVDRALDENNRDETEHGVRDITKFQEPLYAIPTVSGTHKARKALPLTKNSKNAIMPMTPSE